MAKVENDLDIYYAVGNANTQRQENELAAIMKKRNSAGWKLISTSTAIVDTKNQFSNLLGKELVISTVEIYILSQYFKQLRKLFTLQSLIIPPSPC